MLSKFESYFVYKYDNLLFKLFNLDIKNKTKTLIRPV